MPRGSPFHRRRTTTHAATPTEERQGVRVAAPAWAAIDATREISELERPDGLRRVRGVVLGAVVKQRATWQELQQVLGAGSTWHSAHARRAIRDAERGALSAPEAEMADDAIDEGASCRST